MRTRVMVNNYFRIGLVVCCGLILAGLCPGMALADPRMEAARSAYDDGRFEEAIALYQDIRATGDGRATAALHYNLGNALYRIGNLPDAIWHYRAASHLAPRDKDIQHNLRYILEELDALHPTPRFPWSWISRISLAEWAVLAIVMWWLSALYAALALWKRNGRVWLKPLYFSATIGLVAGAGLFYWIHLQIKPELVITRSAQEALFAPIDGSTAHFTVPSGSIVKVDSETELWYSIRTGNKTGWIRKQAVKPITGVL